MENWTIWTVLSIVDSLKWLDIFQRIDRGFLFMWSGLVTFRTLLLCLFFIMVGNGLQGTLLSLRSSLDGFEPGLIGVIMSSYYVGYLVGSRYVPQIVRQVGHVRVFGALTAVAAAAILLYAVFAEPIIWILLRLITGFCFVGIFLTVESWINHFAGNERRGKILSLYMIVQLVGTVLGQLLLNIADVRGFVLFVVISVLLSLGSVPILLVTTQEPRIHSTSTLNVRSLFQVAPLGLVGAFAVGLTLGAYWGMGSLFVHSMGRSVLDISGFMTIVVVGGMVCQWPLGWLSDRMFRAKLIHLMAWTGALVSLILVFSAGMSWSFVLALSFIFGGLSLPLYSILMAHTNDYVRLDQTVDTSGCFILIYGLGAVVGPILVGFMISGFGASGFFLFQMIVYVLLGLYAFRYLLSPLQATMDEVPSMVMPLRPSPIDPVLVMETLQEKTQPEQAQTPVNEADPPK